MYPGSYDKIDRLNKSTYREPRPALLAAPAARPGPQRAPPPPGVLALASRRAAAQGQVAAASAAGLYTNTHSASI